MIISRYSAIQKCNRLNVRNAQTRFYVIPATQKITEDAVVEDRFESDAEWTNALPFNKIPGPSRFMSSFYSWPGGKYHKLSFNDMLCKMEQEYGQIIRNPRLFGGKDQIFIYNPDDIQKVLRTEGIWPNRPGLESMIYYRKTFKPKIYANNHGVINEQGEKWLEFRTKLNPIFMKLQNVRFHLPEFDAVIVDFTKRIGEIRNPKTLEMPANFDKEVQRLAMEFTGVISLNTRFGLIGNRDKNSKGERLMELVQNLFDAMFKLEMKQSPWRYFTTPTLWKLTKTMDSMTDLTIDFIDKAIADFKDDPDGLDKTMLGKMIKSDKSVAIITAIDFVMAGVDPATAGILTCLHHISEAPEKQEILRQEILNVLPHNDTPLTEKSLANMPYLRACIKESLRLVSIAPGVPRTTAQDIVLSGYQIPKGSDVIMAKTAVTNNKYFPQADQYLPERWLRTQNDNAACSARSSHPFAYLPFGFGPRTCLGKRILEMQIELFLIRILRNYKISWHHGEIKYDGHFVNGPQGELKFKFENL